MIKRVKDSAEAGALAMAEDILARSQAEVPVATGELKRSGRIEKGPGGTVAVVYGGPNVRYAASVHNIPGVRYARGKWQYLRDPAMESRKVGAAAAGAVRVAIEG